MTKRLLIGLFFAVLLVTAVTGCNTFRGAGEDIESVGAAMSGSGSGD